MVNVGLFIRLEAKPGKEADVDNFLRGGLFMVEDEPNTTAWFAIRMGPSTFGFFDAFMNETGRQEHLLGKLATALAEKTDELYTTMPTFRRSISPQSNCFSLKELVMRNKLSHPFNILSLKNPKRLLKHG